VVAYSVLRYLANRDGAGDCDVKFCSNRWVVVTALAAGVPRGWAANSRERR
jgi:hypothetical protein